MHKNSYNVKRIVRYVRCQFFTSWYFHFFCNFILHSFVYQFNFRENHILLSKHFKVHAQLFHGQILLVFSKLKANDNNTFSQKNFFLENPFWSTLLWEKVAMSVFYCFFIVCFRKSKSTRICKCALLEY